jgi:hypothetical protein
MGSGIAMEGIELRQISTEAVFETGPDEVDFGWEAVWSLSGPDAKDRTFAH